jgi:hypothetical protein
MHRQAFALRWNSSLANNYTQYNLYTAYNTYTPPQPLKMHDLAEPTRLLYAQLLTQCLASAAPNGRGLSFVSKRIRGGKHWYLQLTAGSGKKQHYLGPDTPEVLAVIANEKALWVAAAPDHASREQLVAMLANGGAHTVGPRDARVFELLERAGVFLAGGVLVGSHAFAIYGDMMGVRWQSETTRTQDIDLASDRNFVIGLPDRKINLRQAIVDSELGFIEVPTLDRKSPSTRFRIRGQPLSVDILTPMVGRTSSKPVHIASLDVYAEPVRFLDYLLIDAQPAAIVAKAGILVNVPAPARFALHKLVLSVRRVAAFQSKASKDLIQAEQLIQLLLRDRPGDLRMAWAAALKQPDKFGQQLRLGMTKMTSETQTKLARITSVKQR